MAFADESGDLVVQLTVPVGTVDIPPLAIDCVDQAGTASHLPLRILLGDDIGPNVFRSTDLLVQGWKARHAKWPIRPPLTLDQLGASQDVLVHAGYPERPDSDRDSGAYKAWFEQVTQPVMVVPPVGLLNSERSHKPNASRAGVSSPASFNGAVQDLYEHNDSWSGVVATGDPMKYRSAMGV
jgi:hypothetical protein